MTIGTRIRARRLSLRLTQAEAAERAGWSQGRWADIEGSRRATLMLSTLEAVARALDTTPKYFLD